MGCQSLNKIEQAFEDIVGGANYTTGNVIILVVQNTDLLIFILGKMGMALAHFVKILTWPLNCNPGPLCQNTDVARLSKY